MRICIITMFTSNYYHSLIWLDKMEDGYSSSGSEHTIDGSANSPVVPPPPPSPDGTNVNTPKTKNPPKKARNSNKGTKLTPWATESQLDDVLFKLALLIKPYKPVKGVIICTYDHLFILSLVISLCRLEENCSMGCICP